jgi:hypothetical protein
MTLIHVFQVAVMGEDAYKTLDPLAMGLANALGLTITGLGAIGTSVWAFALLTIGLAEIHQFSKWRAAATVLVWAIPIGIIFYFLNR